MVIIFQNSNGGDQIDLTSSNWIYGGTLNSDGSSNTLTKATFYLKKYGSPTGTIYCDTYTGTATTPTATSSDTVDASTVPATETAYEFNFSSVAFNDADRCCIRYTTGNPTNHVRVVITTTSVNTSFPMTLWRTAGWYESAIQNVKCTLEGPGAPVSGGTRLPPPPIVLGGL